MTFIRKAHESNTQVFDNPFAYFDAIYCINLKQDVVRWEAVKSQAKALGFLSDLIHFPAVETPENHHIGCALSHRGILKMACDQRHEKILVLEDDVVFRSDTLALLARNIQELQTQKWDLWYLGGHRWKQRYLLADGCESLLEVGLRGVEPDGPTCTHAIAYHSHCYAAISNSLPAGEDEMSEFLKKTLPGIDQMYAFGHQLKRLISEPHIATQPPLLIQEDDAFVPLQTPFEAVLVSGK